MKTPEEITRWCDMMLKRHPNIEDTNFFNSIKDYMKEQRPQGRWIQTEVIDDDSDYGVNADASECSNCKHIESSHYWTTTYYNFCPNCGADMRGDVK